MRRLKVSTRWWNRLLVTNVVLNFCAAAGVGFGAYRMRTVDETASNIMFALAGIIFVFSVAKSFIENETRESASSPEPIKIVLQALVRVLNALPGPKDPKLRVCLHAPVDETGRTVVRITEYIGLRPWHRGDSGKPFSIEKGAVGKAVKSGQPDLLVYTLEDNSDRIEALMAEFGYTEDEANEIRSDRRTWAAMMVGFATDRYLAVLFVDSAAPEYFKKSTAAARRVALQATAPVIAGYITNG